MNAQNVIAAVIERQGRYLVCRRPAHKRHGDLWEFPGGKLEASETFIDAAKRELREELVLEVIDIGSILLAVEDQASGFLINFVQVTAVGEPKLIEHTALEWSEPADLLRLDLAPTDRQFVQFYF